MQNIILMEQLIFMKVEFMQIVNAQTCFLVNDDFFFFSTKVCSTRFIVSLAIG